MGDWTCVFAAAGGVGVEFDWGGGMELVEVWEDWWVGVEGRGVL